MDKHKRARLRSFLLAEHKRGTSCDDAVIEVRRQFGEDAIDARTAIEWFGELAAGKPIVDGDDDHELASIAHTDAHLSYTLRQPLYDLGMVLTTQQH